MFEVISNLVFIPSSKKWPHFPKNPKIPKKITKVQLSLVGLIRIIRLLLEQSSWKKCLGFRFSLMLLHIKDQRNLVPLSTWKWPEDLHFSFLYNSSRFILIRQEFFPMYIRFPDKLLCLIKIERSLLFEKWYVLMN